MRGLIWLRTGTDGSHEHINEPLVLQNLKNFLSSH
jgi:hypothetical protein